MADSDKVHELLGLAVIAAGPIGGNDIDWRMRVERAIPLVHALMGEGSRAWKTAERMTDATMLPPGVLESVEVEERTNRALVRLVGEEHPLRTDHLMSARGKAMKARLDRIQIGSRVLVWRFNEPLRNDPKKTSRVLVHIETLPSFDNDQQNAPASPAPSPTVRSETPAPAPAADPPSGGRGDLDDDGVIDPDHKSVFDLQDPPLTSQQMVRVVRRCREVGITNAAFPPDEDLDKVLVIISEETRT